MILRSQEVSGREPLPARRVGEHARVVGADEEGDIVVEEARAQPGDVGEGRGLPGVE